MTCGFVTVKSKDLCTCEASPRSDLGSVSDCERLARVVTSPRHIGKNGQLKPGVFPPSHLGATEKPGNLGLSLLRIDRLTAEETNLHAKAVADCSPDETPAGLLICDAVKLRDLRYADSEERALCVLDDPVINDTRLPDNPAHAVIIRAGFLSDETETLRIRGKLLDLFGAIQSLP